MGDISFDTSDLDKVAADMGRIPGELGDNLRKAVVVSSRNIKDDWRGKLTGSRGLPGAARSIGYDIEATRSGVEAQIGASYGGQGSLVWVTEYGARHTAPRGYGHRALADEAAGFEKGLGIAVMQAIEAAL